MARADGQPMTCNRCKVVKSLSQFPATGAVCKACKSLTTQDWYRNNLERARKWHKAHGKEYREKNRERLHAKNSEWQRNNPEKRRAKYRRWYSKNKHLHLWRSARDRAKKSGLTFSITPDWVKARLDDGRCSLTGIEFQLTTARAGRCQPFSPSIDRIDSAKGYDAENCRVIVWALNMALSEWGEDIYMTIAKAYLEKRNHGVV